MLAPNHRRRARDRSQSLRHVHHFVVDERLQVGNERRAARGVAEGTQVQVDRSLGVGGVTVAAREVALQQAEQDLRRKKSCDREHRTHESSADNWTTIERDTVDETEMRHASCMTHRDRLRDAAANAVPDNARALDAKLIE